MGMDNRMKNNKNDSRVVRSLDHLNSASFLCDRMLLVTSKRDIFDADSSNKCSTRRIGNHLQASIR